MTCPPEMARAPMTPQLAQDGVVAILRADREDALAPVAHALADAGLRCLELTLTTPGAVQALRRLRPALDPGIALGMGSVTCADQATMALEAGAAFLVSPGVCPEVVRVAGEAGVACYPGGFTATEILTAWELGATAVKLFPAATGGPRHLRDLRGPLPGIPLVPTGGVAIEEIGDYLNAGAAAVGLGGPLVGDALDGGSLAALRERARVALQAVASARAR
ncbi:MAG: bifunctional 4-hydroxy-2-oxoglutarate aldolase/2-dehydro-3-deoxy-phosphogluconate aldolase [Solirubrobacterales bacterium]|nr:bifunctional 4-hydroxy-2-oxoglutarate aldolase/2-dehydro-3-deoxy-phosphogluconate aldolase [Solirubrobacterales bacterium]